MSKSRVIQSKNIVISTQCFHKKGGIENIIQNLALEFTRKNYKVTIFADVSSEINISGKTYLSKIFKLYNYGGIKFLRKLIFLKKLKLKKEVDIKVIKINQNKAVKNQINELN